MSDPGEAKGAEDRGRFNPVTSVVGVQLAVAAILTGPLGAAIATGVATVTLAERMLRLAGEHGHPDCLRHAKWIKEHNYIGRIADQGAKICADGLWELSSDVGLPKWRLAEKVEHVVEQFVSQVRGQLHQLPVPEEVTAALATFSQGMDSDLSRDDVREVLRLARAWFPDVISVLASLINAPPAQILLVTGLTAVSDQREDMRELVWDRNELTAQFRRQANLENALIDTALAQAVPGMADPLREIVRGLSAGVVSASTHGSSYSGELGPLPTRVSPMLSAELPPRVEQPAAPSAAHLQDFLASLEEVEPGTENTPHGPGE